MLNIENKGIPDNIFKFILRGGLDHDIKDVEIRDCTGLGILVVARTLSNPGAKADIV